MEPRKAALDVLAKFNSANVGYCLLRNYDFLKIEVSPGKDVDLCVSRKYEKRITNILENSGFSREKICRFSNHLGYVKYFPSDLKLLKFHIHVGGVVGSTITYLNAVSVVSRRVRFGRGYVLSPEDYVLSTILHAGSAERYRSSIRNLKNLDQSYMLKRLCSIMDDCTANRLLKAILKNDFELIELMWSEVRRSIKSKNKFRHISVRIICGLSKIPDLVRGAPVISFIGMDGSGKTTTTSKVVEILKAHKIKTSRVYTGRGRGNILPIQKIGRPYKRFEKKFDSKSGKNKVVSLKRRIIYNFAALIFYADFLIRYFDIFLKRRTKKVVIVDRFGSDILLMDHVWIFLRKLLYFFTPKPTATIYLYNTVSTLYRRKPNHPRGDLERQAKLFNKILPSMPKVTRIKSVTETQTLKDAMKVVFEELIR